MAGASHRRIHRSAPGKRIAYCPLEDISRSILEKPQIRLARMHRKKPPIGISTLSDRNTIRSNKDMPKSVKLFQRPMDREFATPMRAKPRVESPAAAIRFQ